MPQSVTTSIRAIRRALGLSSEQLGKRVEKAGVTVRYLEKAESTKSATLASLSELAEAMNHELVVTYVPKVSVASQLEQAATTKARGIARRVATSMALENQELTQEHQQLLMEALKRDLIAKPKLLHR
jgi:predicted DNA-binding mobile mystery protein A